MKRTIKTGLAVVLLLAVSCTKENIKNSSPVTSKSTGNSVAVRHIGQHYGGGIIFYVDSTRQHGLIADTVDLPQSKWHHGANFNIGGTGTAIGTGRVNTKRIVKLQGDSETYAALRCRTYEGSGHTDWFLPSQDELKELYKQRSVVGGFAVDLPYWSSSENNINQAYAQDFSNGNQDHFQKNSTFNVRAVREF